MTRECHVRFWERVGVQSPGATRLPLYRQAEMFKRRRELLPKAVPAVVEDTAMVLVAVAPERPRPRRRADRTSIIEIEFGCGARVCLRGEVAPKTLRQMIELLR